MKKFEFCNNPENAFFEADTTSDIKQDSLKLYKLLSSLNHSRSEGSCVILNKGYNYEDDVIGRFDESAIIVHHNGERCLTNKLSISLHHNPKHAGYKDKTLQKCLSAFALYGVTSVLDNISLAFNSNKFDEVDIDLSMLDYVDDLAIYISFDMPNNTKNQRTINIKLPKSIGNFSISKDAYSEKNNLLSDLVKINLSNNKSIKKLKIKHLQREAHILPILKSLKKISSLEIAGATNILSSNKDNNAIEPFALEDFTTIVGLSRLLLDVEKLDLSGITHFKYLTYLGLQINNFTYKNPNIEDIDWFDKNKKPSLFLTIGGLIYNFDDWKLFATAYNYQKSNA